MPIFGLPGSQAIIYVCSRSGMTVSRITIYHDHLPPKFALTKLALTAPWRAAMSMPLSCSIALYPPHHMDIRLALYPDTRVDISIRHEAYTLWLHQVEDELGW